jgi:hypothetical protein
MCYFKVTGAFSVHVLQAKEYFLNNLGNHLMRKYQLWLWFPLRLEKWLKDALRACSNLVDRLHEEPVIQTHVEVLKPNDPWMSQADKMFDEGQVYLPLFVAKFLLIDRQ